MEIATYVIDGRVYVATPILRDALELMEVHGGDKATLAYLSSYLDEIEQKTLEIGFGQ